MDIVRITCEKSQSLTTEYLNAMLLQRLNCKSLFDRGVWGCIRWFHSHMLQIFLLSVLSVSCVASLVDSLVSLILSISLNILP